MEINVQGKGTEYFVPDEVVLNLNFYTKGGSYDKVLKDGTKNVQYFVDEFLLKNDFKKEDMKTRNFAIIEEMKYDILTNKNVPDGFSFNQYATLKFDYDKDKLAKIMVDISKLKNAPICKINFGIKDEEGCRKKVLSKAYRDAEEQASIIALAAGKDLKKCIKVDFKPVTSSYISRANFGVDMMYEKANFDVAESITNTFSPEDIMVTETLYCIWIAE